MATEQPVNKKLARLAEVKARAAVRTRRRLSEQDEEAQVRLEAARQLELTQIAKETAEAEKKAEIQEAKASKKESK